jgi:hypothetical protein
MSILGNVPTITPTLDTSAFIDGDVMCQPVEITNAVRTVGGRCFLQSMHILDESDQGQPFDIIFANASTSLGSNNAAVSISDANARIILGRVQVSSADFYDLIGCRIATLSNIGLQLKAADSSTSIWMTLISRGTGTYAASGLQLMPGLIWG